MARKEFGNQVAESILIKSRRHCAVCDRWCGPNIEIHHIDSSDDSSENNAIPVCFDCHATIGHYNVEHPKGKKYTPNELRKLRNICFQKYDDTPPDLPKGSSEYGRGFHDGVVWTERMMTLKDIWSFLSAHGDFAIENLLYFETEDIHTMMDETYLTDSAVVPYGTQSDSHLSAWSAGMNTGLWGVDGNTEKLFITEKGKVFKELVRTNTSLNQRYEELKEFWDNLSYGEEKKKHSQYWEKKAHDFSPGFLNWLQTEIFNLVRIDKDKSKLFVIHKVTPKELELRDIENGDVIILKEEIIRDAELDHKSGELILLLN